MTSLDGESPPQRAAGVRAGALREPYRPVVRGGAPGNLLFHLRRPRSRLRPGAARVGAQRVGRRKAHICSDRKLPTRASTVMALHYISWLYLGGGHM